MRQGSKIAAGTDRSFLGNNRINLVIQHLAKELDHLESHATKTKRENVRAQENHRAHFRNRERFANAAGMAADKIEL